MRAKVDARRKRLLVERPCERLLLAFRSADLNGDGLLTPQECAALPGLQSRFARFDRNADGLISMEELMNFRRSLSPRRRR